MDKLVLNKQTRISFSLQMDYGKDIDNQTMQPRTITLDSIFLLLCDLAAWIYKATSLSGRELSLLAILCHHCLVSQRPKPDPQSSSFLLRGTSRQFFMNSRAKHRRELTITEHYKRVRIQCLATMPSNIQIHP
jgi:hypothetical protein